MAFLADTHSGHAVAGRGRARMSSVIGSMSEFIAIMGAAVRVANAVEAHRAPKTEDLRALGIEQPLPRSL